MKLVGNKMPSHTFGLSHHLGFINALVLLLSTLSAGVQIIWYMYVYVIGNNNNKQQSLFVPQKLYSVDINTRKKKNYKGKEHSHLEIAKLIELSGLAKQKKFNFHCVPSIIYSSAGVLL